MVKVKKGIAIPVTGRGGPWGCEMLRLPHFVNNRLTDGGKVVSLTRRTPFNPLEDSWYSFLLRGWVEPRGIVQLEGLGQLKISNNLTEKQYHKCNLGCFIRFHPICVFYTSFVLMKSKVAPVLN
jgi:hypothetical protein